MAGLQPVPPPPGGQAFSLPFHPSDFPSVNPLKNAHLPIKCMTFMYAKHVREQAWGNCSSAQYVIHIEFMSEPVSAFNHESRH